MNISTRIGHLRANVPIHIRYHRKLLNVIINCTKDSFETTSIEEHMHCKSHNFITKIHQKQITKHICMHAYTQTHTHISSLPYELVQNLEESEGNVLDLNC